MHVRLQGALLAVVSTSSAAMLAFQLSRRLGQKMAEKAAAEEISEEQRQSGIFSRVQNAIESGSFQQQVVAVTLLRLTPVVPFRSVKRSHTFFLLPSSVAGLHPYTSADDSQVYRLCIQVIQCLASQAQIVEVGIS